MPEKRKRKLVGVVGLALFALAALFGTMLGRTFAADDASHGANDAAVKEVVAGFSNGWNSHDAHAMCASLADDVRWVSWRGEVYSSRAEVESVHAKLFADLYKNTHRTDEVKAISYIGPNDASVDDYWSMTGARTREGADWPYRAGYVNLLMSKRGGHWIVVAAHTADFNAKVPAAH
jgi:uncharacterized protein (TIGR02246 family)